MSRYVLANSKSACAGGIGVSGTDGACIGPTDRFITSVLDGMLTFPLSSNTSARLLQAEQPGILWALQRGSSGPGRSGRREIILSGSGTHFPSLDCFNFQASS